MTNAGPASLVLASNRGPVSFSEHTDGTLTLRRGAGGLVSGLVSAGRQTEALWICAALTDADRSAVRRAPQGRLDLDGHDTGGSPVRMLDIDPLTFTRAYNGIANSTLWFLHHLLWATPTKPVFDLVFRREWGAYRAFNRAFAEALAEEAAPGAKVLIQDYHLTLAPGMLRDLRPDLRIGHFSHTPWAPPEYFRLLPRDIAGEVLTGLLAADQEGFLAPRWAQAFLECCADVLDAQTDLEKGLVKYEGRTTRVAVHALGVAPAELLERAHRSDVEARRATLTEQIGDLRVILRVDRTELSKNIVRGLLAYRELLRTHPEWREQVVHLAFAYPSRHDLPEYREYTAAVLRLSREIEDEFGTANWQPVRLHVNDDFPRSLAALRIADVLLVNPVRDGMNLVAKEGPVISERGCALVLSTEAGAAHELAGDALMVNPYDVSGTAEALHQALSMDEAERSKRCAALAAASTALPPAAWFAQQVDTL